MRTWQFHTKWAKYIFTIPRPTSLLWSCVSSFVSGWPAWKGKEWQISANKIWHVFGCARNLVWRVCGTWLWHISRKSYPFWIASGMSNRSNIHHWYVEFLQFFSSGVACPFPWGKNFASGSRMRASKSAAALILGGSKPELQLGFSLENSRGKIEGLAWSPNSWGFWVIFFGA